MPPAGPSDRRRKRSLEPDDREHPPPKGPRLSNDGLYARYNARMQGRGRGGFQSGRGMGRGDAPMNTQPHMQAMEGQMFPGQQGGFAPRPRRGICRDYHSASHEFSVLFLSY